MATTATQRIPNDEQIDGAMQVLWLGHQIDREERRLLMELLTRTHRALDAVLASQRLSDLAIYDEVHDCDMAILRVLRGEGVARVMRPDEDPDMEEVPF